VGDSLPLLLAVRFERVDADNKILGREIDEADPLVLRSWEGEQEGAGEVAFRLPDAGAVLRGGAECEPEQHRGLAGAGRADHVQVRACCRSAETDFALAPGEGGYGERPPLFVADSTYRCERRRH